MDKKKNQPRLDINSSTFKISSGLILSTIITIAANSFLGGNCDLSVYLGNLLFIFIATWISWMGLSALYQNKSTSTKVSGMIVSLVAILIGAFFCIAVTGFWIAPVCD